MSELVTAIVNQIEKDLALKLQSSSDGQYRGVFSGPPSRILNQVLHFIVEKGGVDLAGLESQASFPVLLPTRDSKDPSDLYSSGVCSDAHLVKVRTSECKQFLILLSPGHPLNESMDSTIQEMGISRVESRPAYKTPFYKRLLDQGIELHVPRSHVDDYIGAAHEILERELSRRDEEKQDHSHQWIFLERLFNANATGLCGHELLLSLFGLVACDSKQFEPRDHMKLLNRLAEFLESNGFRPGFEELKEKASSELREALEQCYQHLHKNCDSASDFKDAPTSKYSPIILDAGKCVIPQWWHDLTLEKWTELLETSSSSKPNDNLEVTCTNRVCPDVKGFPTVVQSCPEFRVMLKDAPASREVRITRSIGRKTPEEMGLHVISGDGLLWIDDKVPEHSSHLQYTFKVCDLGDDETKPIKLKVIALDSYEIGIIPYCRNAGKTTLFKEVKKKSRKKVSGKRRQPPGSSKSKSFECTVEVQGMGMHQLDLYFANGLQLGKAMTGFEVTSEKDVHVTRPINQSGSSHAVSIVETDEECYYMFEAELGSETSYSFRINIEAGDEAPVGAESEFDRLVIEHQKKIDKDRSGGATIEIPGARCSDLQRWMLEDSHSYRPLIIGPDFESAWTQPDWEGDALLSSLELLHDPRPPFDEFVPPSNFIAIRSEILERIGKDSDNDYCLIEEISLGNLMQSDENFGDLIYEYINTYALWLIDQYEIAAWCDIVLACHADTSGGSLNPDPYAILFSPLHPIRLAWHCQAQQILKKALDEHKPCPAASTLDPNTFPDCMALPTRDTSGSNQDRGFLAVGSSSDYWHVLWSCDKLGLLSSQDNTSLFGAWFGVTTDGLASGFSAGQVKRSIDEMRRIYSAKTRLSLLVDSDSKGTSSCNKGIESWVGSRLGPDNDPWFGVGSTQLDLIDTRPEDSQPLESQIARVSDQSGGTLHWFTKRDSNSDFNADLAVLAHLGTANPNLEKHKIRSALGNQGLTRWRVRRQTGNSGKFIAETRVGKLPDDRDGLVEPLLDAVFQIEKRFGTIGDSHVFAPNLPALSKTLKKARYCAVSSSTLDPACFFGQTGNFYLWDYDLPSYSRRAGENSGYYLLAAESDAMREAISGALNALKKDKVNKDVNLVHSLLAEIAYRGMPTLKRLTCGGSSALGELGMLVALRLLQGDFIKGISSPGIIPVRDSSEGCLTLVIPIDPFAAHFDALRKSMGGKTFVRPDLLVASVKFEGDNCPCSLQLTPVEVKARRDTMTSKSRQEALLQASNFADFLKDLWTLGNQYEIWEIAWKHLLCSWLDYGFRVYGQLDTFQHDDKWSECHQNLLCKTLGNALPTAIDPRGRLVVTDDSNLSDIYDEDDDGFHETLVISLSDAHKIVTEPGHSIIPSIVDKLGAWGTRDAYILETDSAVPNPAEKLSEPHAETCHAQARDDAYQSSELLQENDSNECDRKDVVSEDDSSKPSVLVGVAEPSEEELHGNDEGVRFVVGSSIGGFNKKDLFFHPSNTELNQLNIGIVGDLGTGKTQLLQSLLYQLHNSREENRGVSPNVLIFDYKKDYKKDLFRNNTNAKIVQPFDIPLNLFDTKYCTNKKNPWLERSRFFNDILSKIYSGIGPKQKYQLKESIKAAYDRAGLNQLPAPTIYDVFEKYGEACGDSYDTPYSIMSNIVDQGIFVSSHQDTMSFREFFKGVVVLDLGALGQDDETKNMLVAIFLNLFYENMLNIDKKPFIGSNPKLRALDSFLLVDEADNIMRYEFDVLRRILLQGREFGVGVILASQYPSHFKTARENYAETLRSWFIHKVPNVSAKLLQSMGFNDVNEETAERIKDLDCHECLYRSHGTDGEFMRGLPLFELVRE